MSTCFPVPLTILTGFLGAGKTTLVNRFLSFFVKNNQKVAFIQNEFSDLGVEETLISSSSNSNGKNGETMLENDIVELANGCVCCTVRNNFVTALEELVAKKKYDYFVLECSGMVDPAALVKMFQIDSDLEPKVQLDGIITLVDCLNFSSQMNSKDAPQILSQIAYADRVILNKTDLCDFEKISLEKIKNRIREINSLAVLFCTHHSNVECEKLLNISAFSIENSKYVAETFNSIIGLDKRFVEYVGKECCNHHESINNFVLERRLLIEDGENNLSSLNYEKSKYNFVNLQKLNIWLSEILWSHCYEGINNDSVDEEAQQQILRMKGVILLSQNTHCFLQSVRELYEISDERAIANSFNQNELCTRIVIIGRNLNKDDLFTGFEKIFD